MVEPQASVQAPLGQQGGGHDQELVLLLGGEMHGKG
jgi:hypothetical protein